jgi:single-stranded DNA-binding protein
MKSINRITLLGKVASTPHISHGDNGGTIARIEVLTTYFNRLKVLENDLHELVYFDNLANFIRDFVRKNDLVHAEGRLKNDVKVNPQTQERTKVCEILGTDIIGLWDGRRSERR